MNIWVLTATIEETGKESSPFPDDKWSNSRQAACFPSPFESTALSFKFFLSEKPTRPQNNTETSNSFLTFPEMTFWSSALTDLSSQPHSTNHTGHRDTQRAPCSPQTRSSALPSQAGPPPHRPPTKPPSLSTHRSRRWGSCEGRIPAASHSTEKCLAYEMRLRSEPPLSRLRLPVRSGPPWAREGSAAKACGGWGVTGREKGASEQESLALPPRKRHRALRQAGDGGALLPQPDALRHTTRTLTGPPPPAPNTVGGAGRSRETPRGRRPAFPPKHNTAPAREPTNQSLSSSLPSAQSGAVSPQSFARLLPRSLWGAGPGGLFAF